jgi:hypothetical protein
MNQLELLITLAANNVKELRVHDVYRVLDAADEQHLLSDMADYLKQARPDLLPEIASCMEDIGLLNANVYVVQI